MGPGEEKKSLVPPFIPPPAITQFERARYFGFVMRENVARGFVRKK